MSPTVPKPRSHSLQTAIFAAILLSGAASAQTLPVSCNTGEQSTLSLSFTDDLRPVVDADIDGNRVSAMVNIGSSQTVVFNKKTLDRIGIKTRNITSTSFQESRAATTNVVPINDVQPSGMFIVREALGAYVNEFVFGRVKNKEGLFLVEDFFDDSFGARIGAGSLLQTDLEVNLDGGYLRYFNPDNCFREHLAYWDQGAAAVPIKVDLWKRDPRPIFNVVINGKEVPALLSTATPHSYLPAVAASRLGLASTVPGAIRQEPLPGHSQEKPVWNVPVAQMSVGGLDVRDFSVRLMDLPNSGELLVLGADFLHRHRVYIAMSQRQIYFSTIDNPAPKRGSVEVIPQPRGS